jgi:hypothetical protein
MQPTESEASIKVFVSYSHADQELCKKLEDHLSSLKYSGKITIWQDQEIPPGATWGDQIYTQLNNADLILLLISASFIASKYCWSKEVEIALQRHKDGNARVVPIILKPVHWQDTPLGQLQALPTGAKPVTRWNDQDDAFEDVVSGIRKVVEDLRVTLREQYQKRWQSESKDISDYNQYLQATSGPPTFADPLSNNCNNWNEGSYNHGSCYFAEGAYHVTATPQCSCACGAEAFPLLSDFAFQVQITFVQGNGGGFVFRFKNNEGYLFYIRPDGTYTFRVTVRQGNTNTVLLDGRSSAISTGQGQRNLIAVLARGNTFVFFVNHQFLAKVSDSTHGQGFVSPLAENHSSDNSTHIAFQNGKAWAL